ncbi:putative RNA/DNA demethylase ALKBH6 isoform X1 [Styela clava]
MDAWKLLKCPDVAFYMPNFITDKEEEYLVNEVYKSPKPKWTVLSNRRLQNWGGIPHPKGMVQENLPKWLNDCCDKVSNLGVFADNKPNHVLVNEYKPGQGIMPHQDGPLYYPTVTTISLGSHTILDFYDLRTGDDRSCNEPKFSLLLERRSLLILQELMYESHMHGISERSTDVLNKDFVYNFDNLGDETLKSKIISESEFKLDRKTRISLTIRNVPKTVKIKLQIGRFR